jgi:HJR/Mrr/RecB family endonuclease
MLENDFDVIFEMLPFFASLLFSFWPLIVFGTLRRARRNIVPVMLLAWTMMVVPWLIVLVTAAPIVFPLIPEPFNSVLFLAVGVLLMVFQFGGKYWRRRQIWARADAAKGVADLLNLSPTEFEELVLELYTAMGHQATRTGATGDHGVDVVVKAKNGEKWVVQCKRWRGSVGEPVIRDFFGAMHHEKADKGAIITTGMFTPQARAWAEGKPMSLIEGDKFLDYLKRARNKSSRKASAEKNTAG